MEVNESGARYSKVAQMQETDIGPLPSDWRVVPLTALSEKIMVGIASAATHAYRDRGVVMFRNQNIRVGMLDTDDVLFIDPKYEQTYRNKRLKGGDLLTARTGYPGTTSVVPASFEGSQSFTTLITRPNVRVADALYLCFFINGGAGQKYFEQAQIGGGQKNVNAASLKLLSVALPSTLEEQTAIAEALSDADALIESLLLLLAKKRQIKQGAMHELLTGKKRLPGFSQAWSKKRLARFGEFLKGRGITRDQSRSGHLPCVRYGEIYTCHGDVIQRYESWISPAVAANAIRLRSGDILFAGSGETKEEIGKCTAFVSPDEAYAGGDIVILRTQSAASIFLSYLLNTAPVQALKASRGQGDAVVHISSAALADIEILVPDEDEQVAIGIALQELDADIDALMARIAKVRDLKQGVMQALLTGRIRLVPPASNVIPLPLKPAAAHPPPPQPAHNWQINEAVVIGVLSQRFGSEKFPLPRKRRVKLMYLLHRYAEGRAEGYLKKAAGPYDPNTKYKGPEAIALKNGYVRALHNGTYEGFVAGDKVEQAQRYFEQWYGTAALDWLERFQYRKTDDLELLATVDMAMVDLAAAGQPADVAGVKRVIAAHPEWVPKLSRELFSDENIARATAECATLFTA